MTWGGGLSRVPALIQSAAVAQTRNAAIGDGGNDASPKHNGVGLLRCPPGADIIIYL